MGNPKKQCNTVAPIVEEQESLVDTMAQYVLYVMSRFTMEEKDGKSDYGDNYGLWGRLPECLKKDRRIATAAMVNLLCKVSDLPIEHQTDEMLLLQCVQQQPKCWLSLPEHLKNDARFAMAMAMSPSTGLETLDNVLQRFPDNRELWKKSIDNYDIGSRILLERADATIRSDGELMLAFCTRRPSNLQDVHATLQVDKGFLDLLLQKKPEALRYMSPGTQRQFPELLKDHLRPLFRRLGWNNHVGHQRIFIGIVPEFWNNRQHVLSWFRAGGHLIRDMPKDWRNDREILLLVAENNMGTCNEEALRHASRTFWGDVEFAMNALEYRPTLFFWFDNSVRGDLDVALLGCAGLADFRLRCEDNERWDNDFPRNLAAATADRVNSLMTAHKSMETLLLGMSDDSSGCLSMLDLGHETSLGFKQLIASFLDVPVGRKLRHVRKAARHLGVK